MRRFRLPYRTARALWVVLMFEIAALMTFVGHAADPVIWPSFALAGWCMVIVLRHQRRRSRAPRTVTSS